MSSILNGKNIVMGMSGGIAAYKAVDLISRLKKANAEVDVILTEHAEKFITPLTIQTMSKNVCNTDMFNVLDVMDPKHISLAKKADLIVIAPATANIIGKIANGIADDFLTTVIMAARCDILIAPAMNTYMYTNRIFQENLKKLIDFGFHVIKPEEGLLACGDVGLGKMEEPSEIMEHIEYLLTDKDLSGKKIIVTAGPTIEDIDPVRFISNRSSGKMGYAIAKEASSRGAEVILISGPTHLKTPFGVKRIDVRTTQEMLNAVDRYFDYCDCLIKAAAPADFKVNNFSEYKIKKQENMDSIELKLIENPDIAQYFGNKKGNKFIIGFAAETNDGVENAKNKILKKNLDFIVLNDVSKPGAGFDIDTNIITIIDSEGQIVNYPILCKSETAKMIINYYKSKIGM